MVKISPDSNEIIDIQILLFRSDLDPSKVGAVATASLHTKKVANQSTDVLATHIEIRDIGDILLCDVVDDLYEVLRVFPFDAVGLQESCEFLLVDVFKICDALLVRLDELVADHKEGLLGHREFL